MLGKIRQKGFLLLSAVIIIIAIAFIAATATYVFTVNARTSANEQLTTQAFFVAQSGLEVGVNRYIGNDATQRLVCSAITGDVSLTNTAFGTGEFTVTATSFAPTPTALTDAINASDTVIRIISNTGYAESGTVFIDSELVDYAGIGTTLAQCTSTPPCLINAVRGVGGTTPAVHTAAIPVYQSLCRIQSTGFVPDEANALASRTLQQDAVKGGFPIWATGSQTVGEHIEQWDGSDWDRFPPSASIPNVTMLGVHVNSLSSAWIVGVRNAATCGVANRGMFLQYNGESWTRVCASTNVNQNLFDVHCATENYCIASGNARTFAKWDGGAWTNTGGTGGIPNTRYNGVFCLAANDCFAVGRRSGGFASVAHWDNVSWTRITNAGPNNILNQHLNAIDCATSTDCWAVGENRHFLHYDGTNWVDAAGLGIGFVSIAAARDFNGVACPATNYCLAVGDRSGGNVYLAIYDGVNWTRQTGATVAAAPYQNYFGVFCLATDECYAVGAAGTAIFWDGAAWSDVSGSIPTSVLRAVHGVAGGISGNYTSGWQEEFN